MELFNRNKKPPNSGSPNLAQLSEVKRPGDYLRTVRHQLRDGKTKEAYAVLLKAVAQHPDDPFLLSYFGYLQALVDKKFRSGISACTRAILLLKKKGSFSEDLLYPVFYQNLGRACLAAGRKKEAIDAFKKGLIYDKGNGDLKAELQGMGVRKKPPLAFLERSNPINRAIGKILHKTRKKRR
jgi:tetratricopeptide (TPR) repeat protein